MTLRVLFAGALTALPLLVSGALAQTTAAPPAVTISPAPSANPASPPASTTSVAPPAQIPANQPAATATSAPPSNPATPSTPTQGLASPFMPQARSPPTAGTDSAPGASPSTAAPIPAQAAAPPKPKKVAPPAPPRETALSDDPRPTLQPDTFFATAKASERYSAIVDAGGWPTDIAAIGPGTKGPAVAKLRKRLAIEGDLTSGEASGLAWDSGLTAAVKRFQARMGLRLTGIVSGATLKAINVPARERFNELASSANRLAGLNFSFDERYVVVNIPST